MFLVWGLIILAAAVGLGLLAVTGRTWWLPKRSGLAAVMYHHIGFAQAGDPQFPFTIAPRMFEAHIRLLKQHGYTILGLDELERYCGGQQPIPAKPALLTFDDGYEDNYTLLFPLLKKHNTKAVIFLVANYVGTPGYLTWEQIFQMQKSGLVTFGSHGVSHRRLRKLQTNEIRQELTASKKSLEEKLGQPVNAFCYPFGAGGFDKRVRPLVFQAGYLFDVSTRKGINPWPWKGKRSMLRVFPRGAETLFDFYLQITRGKNRF